MTCIKRHRGIIKASPCGLSTVKLSHCRFPFKTHIHTYPVGDIHTQRETRTCLASWPYSISHSNLCISNLMVKSIIQARTKLQFALKHATIFHQRRIYQIDGKKLCMANPLVHSSNYRSDAFFQYHQLLFGNEIRLALV